MAINYAFDYAEIDPATNMCVGVHSTSYESTDPYWVLIPVNDPDYLLKYYICATHNPNVNGCTCGAWYEDPEGTIPWTSSMV